MEKQQQRCGLPWPAYFAVPVHKEPVQHELDVGTPAGGIDIAVMAQLQPDFRRSQHGVLHLDNGIVHSIQHRLLGPQTRTKLLVDLHKPLAAKGLLPENMPVGAFHGHSQGHLTAKSLHIGIEEIVGEIQNAHFENGRHIRSTGFNLRLSPYHFHLPKHFLESFLNDRRQRVLAVKGLKIADIVRGPGRLVLLVAVVDFKQNFLIEFRRRIEISDANRGATGEKK